MHGLIRYKVNENTARRILRHHKLYVISTKDTYYGIHRSVSPIVSKKQQVQPTSKTALLTFIEYKHSLLFQGYLEEYLQQGLLFNRNVYTHLEEPSFLCSEPLPITTFLPPLSVHTETSEAMELMCILNFFDIIVISQVKKKADQLYVYGYEHIVQEPPNRTFLEYKLRYLLQL